MEYSNPDAWQSPKNARTIHRKLREVISHPLTFIVLVWLFLFLVFYLVSEII